MQFSACEGLGGAESDFSGAGRVPAELVLGSGCFARDEAGS